MAFSSSTQKTNQDQMVIDVLRLLRSENIGPVTFHKLVTLYGDPATALQHLPDMARRGGRKKPVRLADMAAVMREIDMARHQGMTLLPVTAADYPNLLRQCRDAPPLLYVYGSVPLLSERQIGIVGSRNATAASVALSRKLAAGVSAAGITVTSGMARGIDSAAHLGGLTGPGSTIAVLAGGLDVIYPPENAGLYRQIAETGAVVSEMPPGAEPKARQFLSRNRIIAGLSAGLVVVEAAARSGSLSTARLAADYGRDIMAVPGSPVDPRSRGTNKLLKDGAALVENSDDILAVMKPIMSWSVESGADPFRFNQAPVIDGDKIPAKIRQQLLSLLGPVPTEVDELMRQCQVSPAELHLMLLELELAGRLVHSPGNKVSLTAEAFENAAQNELFDMAPG